MYAAAGERASIIEITFDKSLVALPEGVDVSP
jgi:hypothetical protein